MPMIFVLLQNSVFASANEENWSTAEDVQELFA